jgi:hypothetical protein
MWSSVKTHIPTPKEHRTTAQRCLKGWNLERDNMQKKKIGEENTLATKDEEEQRDRQLDRQETYHLS